VEELLQMLFIIEEKVFEALPEVCFGVVIAREVKNSTDSAAVKTLLEKTIESTRSKFASVKPKEHPDMAPYREAFQKMGINPNKFPSSIEALTTRIAKGGSLPNINPAVNLVNAISLKYSLPMGAHDLDTTEGNIEVRFSKDGDRFTPFGEIEPEILEAGELVYAAGSYVKTRKWIWRQSDLGKVTAASKNIFFPIDGFANYNSTAVLSAREDLATALKELLGSKVTSYYLDRNNRSIEIG
jgi:DNA/RNA-binding domain of Phe-tRNA-synthetase-like protein